jgi:hypothetical protein
LAGEVVGDCLCVEGEGGGIIGEDAGGNPVGDGLLAAELVEDNGDSDSIIFIYQFWMFLCAD